MLTSEKSFSCDICQKTFRYKSQLSQHTQIHTAEKLFSCVVCQKNFRTKYGLLQHMNIHTGARNYSCDLCQRKYTTKYILSKHMETHTKEYSYSSVTKPFFCDVCQIMHRKKCELRRHRRVHTQIASKETIIQTTREPSVCKLLSLASCWKTCLVQPNLVEKLYFCAVCEKSFTQKEVMQNHMKSHTDGTPYSCDNCKKEFTITDPFFCIKQCTDVTVSFCAMCKEAYTQQSVFLEHIQRHRDGQIVSCNECKKVFRQRQELSEHMKSHTFDQKGTSERVGSLMCINELPIRTACQLMSVDLHQSNPLRGNENRLICALCTKTFPQKQDLQNHMKFHTSGILLSCSQCNKTFTLTSDIFVCIKKCTGSTVFYCVVCKKTYPNQSGFLAHMRSHTLGQDLCSGMSSDTAAEAQSLPENMDSNHDNALGQNLSSDVNTDIVSQGQDLPQYINSSALGQSLSSDVNTAGIVSQGQDMVEYIGSNALEQSLSSCISTDIISQGQDMLENIDSSAIERSLTSGVSTDMLAQGQELKHMNSSPGKTVSTGVYKKTSGKNQDLLEHKEGHILEHKEGHILKENLSCDMQQNAIGKKLTCMGTYSSDSCQRKYASKCTLNKYKKSHITCTKEYYYSGETKPFFCEVCQMMHGKKCKHRRVHTQIAFPTRTALHSHLACKDRKIQTTREPSECKLLSLDSCWETCSVQPNLLKKLYFCAVCKKRFTQKEEMQYHMKSHTDGTSYSCQNCKKKFTITDPFVCIKQCTGATVSFCAMCKETFKQSSVFLEHIQGHRDGQIVSNDKVKLYRIKGTSRSSQALSCCLCRTKSSTLFLADYVTGIVLCEQCKLSSTCCSLCNQEILFLTLRTHIGYHTGELVCQK